MIEIGKTQRLMIVREVDQGFYLNGQNLGEILMPKRLTPEDVEQGDEIDVFIYRDATGVLIGTTEKPLCEAGKCACLEVLSVHPKAGAFLNWGLSKDLLLPFAEQTQRVRPGERVIVFVTVDERSDRLIASARTQRFLRRAGSQLRAGEAVGLLVTERTPLGYNAIVDHAYPGLLAHANAGRALTVGETLRAFVHQVRPAGMVELALQPVESRGASTLPEQILEALAHNQGRLELGDKSPPDAIRRVFACSKKAFKQALGTLYKKRLIALEADGRSVRLLQG